MMAREIYENDPLQKEKSWLDKVILQLEFIQGYRQGVNRQKNAADSKLYRMKGNELFKSQLHNLEIHQAILEKYSQSIALAPNESEELALAHGNRSALLLHLKKYEECLEDCNRAINITKSELLTAKLVCRKLECLAAMGDESFNNEFDETQKHLMEMKLSNDIKTDLINKINRPKNSASESQGSADDKDREKSKTLTMQPHPSELFDHQKEIPCASEAVTIEYNEEWGRHITATRDIDPGEIVAVENDFHKFVFTEHMYVCCNYCVKFSWASIPCESCIYGIYCSEKCRAAAWEEFHKFECKIFPHVWDIAEDLVSAAHGMRFFFKLIHKAGGIEKLRQEFMDLQKCKDTRSRGFSDDGVFHSDRSRSVLSLDGGSTAKDDEEVEKSTAYNAANALYYLVRETDFFGKKMDDCLICLVSQNDLIQFFGALFIRVAYMTLLTGSELLTMTDDEEFFIGYCMSPFCGLFNHSCDPNVRFIRSKNNETIVYAKRPIKKGEQLFRSYGPFEYTESSKEERENGSLKLHKFTCKCLACENDWSHESLPPIMDVLKETLEPNEVVEFFKRMSSVILKSCIPPSPNSSNEKYINKMSRVKCSKFKPGFLTEVVAIQKEIATNADVYCQEYDILDQYVLADFLRTYGPWLDVPETC